MKPVKSILYLLLILFIIPGCTFQKRLYRNGFYVHSGSQSAKTEKPAEKILSLDIPNQLDGPITASSDNKIILITKPVPPDSVKDICNDSIWTKEGAVSRVKVLEVTQDEIKYKRCANINGPVIVVSQQSISKIRYANGLVEYYKDIKNKLSSENAKTNLHQGSPVDIGITPGICGILFILCGIIAITTLFMEAWPVFAISMVLGAVSYFATWISSVISLIRIKKQPEKYKGKGKALAALIVVAAYTALVLAVLLFGRYIL